MAMKQKRACVNCHKAKVKCLRVEGFLKCKRCERLGLKCVEHVSRQGQGTRRRKKVKTKGFNNEDMVDEALGITTALTPICNTINEPSAICPSMCPTTRPTVEEPTPTCPMSANINGCAPCPMKVLNISKSNPNGREENRICSGMATLEIEDNLICKSITNGMTRDHFGLHYLIREWVALAFSRRSFDLLARASFIAAKMKISMDDIISNQSPFAAATDSEPMEYLARDLLLSKSQRKTLGYSIDLLEVPWDLLEAVQINPNRSTESVRNRWVGIRWTQQGVSRFWTSPLFDRDFANVEEIGLVYEANSGDMEVVDLFLPRSEKKKFATEIFNLLFVNHKPNMDVFVVKNRYKVHKRNNPEPIEVDVIQSMKLIDLDSMLHYFEIQFVDQKIDHLIAEETSNVNKREHGDLHVGNVNDDPIMGDIIEFTDIEMTGEMEEFLKLLSGE